jgi:hypothetical protein
MIHSERTGVFAVADHPTLGLDLTHPESNHEQYDCDQRFGPYSINPIQDFPVINTFNHHG